MIGLLCLCSIAVAAPELPGPEVLREWISEMKTNRRGPFVRIRWFCADGTVLPPRPYACGPHGGGVQHGEWSERVKTLRANGYHIANVLAAIDPDTLLAQEHSQSIIAQILIEQFLIRSDDGWILRRARTYRGALQEEDERRVALALLQRMAADPQWLTRDYTVLRVASRYLRHGAETPSVVEVRQLSGTLAEQNPAFKMLRNRIHSHPSVEDADRVRRFARRLPADDAAEYHRLAALIDEAYKPRGTLHLLETLAAQLHGDAGLARLLRDGIAQLRGETSAEQRLTATARLMAGLRDHIAGPLAPAVRVQMLDTSLALENAHYTAATALTEGLGTASRAQRLAWLEAGAQAAYGSGLISPRQRDQLVQAFARLKGEPPAISRYKSELEYLAHLPAWAGQRLRFHFDPALRRFTTIEPLADRFLQDLQRGGPLLFYAEVLDTLLHDANSLSGVPRSVFGRAVGHQLKALNPGLARGRLRLEPEPGEAFDPAGIYLLPETRADLPPVAGILTAGEGNLLSHVQLLARNLGIPNVAVAESLLPEIGAHAGERVLLAVSPRAAIELRRLSAEEALAEDRRRATSPPTAPLDIATNLEELELLHRDPVPLSALRTSDAGRIVGPKAANLGELHHHYPDSVADGLAIPFGVFRAVLDRPYRDTGLSMFEWMQERYRHLETLPAGSEQRREQTDAARSQLQRWLEQVPLDDPFVARLEAAMEQVFGPAGSYGVFVRSDTNVEDLPGFTGAGLNLTVPHVVGTEGILAAIPRVWASPFSERAFAWRQGRMDRPEHVYPAVLLMRSVDADKSGVMVTQDIDNGDPDWLSIAVNEGVGGAVEGQAAEALRAHIASGEVRLMDQATAPTRRALDPQGGVVRLPASGSDNVLQSDEIVQLRRLASELPDRFPPMRDAEGRRVAAEVEFGFVDGHLQLFQIRPFLESSRARTSQYLQALDRREEGFDIERSVALDEPPHSVR